MSRASHSGLNKFGQLDFDLDWDDGGFEEGYNHALSETEDSTIENDSSTESERNTEHGSTTSTSETTDSVTSPNIHTHPSTTTPSPSPSPPTPLTTWATTPPLLTARHKYLSKVLTRPEDAPPGALRIASCYLRAERSLRQVAETIAHREADLPLPPAFPPGATGTKRPLPSFPPGAKGLKIVRGRRVFRPVRSRLGMCEVVGEGGWESSGCESSERANRRKQKVRESDERGEEEKNEEQDEGKEHSQANPSLSFTTDVDRNKAVTTTTPTYLSEKASWKLAFEGSSTTNSHDYNYKHDEEKALLRIPAHHHSHVSTPKPVHRTKRYAYAVLLLLGAGWLYLYSRIGR